MGHPSYRVPTSEEATVRALEHAYDTAWSAGDVEGILSFFTNDAVIVNPTGRVISGLPQIEAAYRSFLSGDAATTHASIIKAVYFVTGEVAVVDGEATIHGLTSQQGSSTHHLIHLFTDVLVKSDGVWRICHIRADRMIPTLVGE